MKSMTEEEFEKLEHKTLPKDCKSHNVVRITDFAGAHNDYGCITCGLKHTRREVFDKAGLTGYR